MNSKTLLSITGAAALALTVAAPSIARADTWDIDQSHSHVAFSIKHMMVSNVKGSFEKFAGTVELDEKDPTKSTVAVEIDTASIRTADEKRDAHLKSADFFDSEKYPKMTFKSTKVQKLGKDKLKVTGDLTIKDVTKPVVLTVEGPAKPVKDPWGGTRSALTATGAIKRKDFNLTWNKALETGGVVVGDDVKLELEVELLKKPAGSAS
jgi:polyisoprenoid-binding protein YceI